MGLQEAATLLGRNKLMAKSQEKATRIAGPSGGLAGAEQNLEGQQGR